MQNQDASQALARMLAEDEEHYAREALEIEAFAKRARDLRLAMAAPDAADPEPAIGGMLAMGMLALFLRRRRVAVKVLSA